MTNVSEKRLPSEETEISNISKNQIKNVSQTKPILSTIDEKKFHLLKI